MNLFAKHKGVGRTLPTSSQLLLLLICSSLKKRIANFLPHISFRHLSFILKAFLKWKLGASRLIRTVLRLLPVSRVSCRPRLTAVALLPPFCCYYIIFYRYFGWFAPTFDFLLLALPPNRRRTWVMAFVCTWRVHV